MPEENQTTTTKLTIMISLIFFVFLLIANALTEPIFAMFVMLFFFLLWEDKKKRHVFTEEEIEKKTYDFIQQKMIEGKIDSGTIRISPETDMKPIVVIDKGEVKTIPFAWWVVAKTDSPKKAYLVKWSIYGTNMGYSQIKKPDEFSMQKTKPFIKFTLEKGERAGKLVEEEEENKGEQK